MATNPNNAIGTNAAFGGRTSPNAFNDVLGAFQGRGIVSGWECSPDSGMTVVLGGNGTTRDVAIAEDSAGNKTTVDNIPASPISLTIAAAPATQSRIDAVVVYVNNPPQGSSTAVDNYGTVGILDVQGTVASSPVAPNDSEIRTAITADGASGATAYYVVLAYITVGSGTTTITSNEISQGDRAIFNSDNIALGNGAVSMSNIDWTSLGVIGDYITTEMETPFKDYNGDTIYRIVVDCGTLPNTDFKYVSINTLNVKNLMRLTGVAKSPTTNGFLSLPGSNPNAGYSTSLALAMNNSVLCIALGTGTNRSTYTQTYVELLYTKN